MATYYIDPTGVDSSARNGLSTPAAWLTLNYAITRATISGDIIHVNAGTYTISTQVRLPLGVSIEGAGVTSVFNCTVTATGSWGNAGYAILLSSSSLTTGSQHISNIKMNGNSYAGYGAIGIWFRRNVTINNCTIQYFNKWGVRFYGGEPPAAGSYMTGSVFHTNIVNDCGGWTDGSLGCLCIGGLDGMLIYGNTITQPADRGQTNEGEPIFGVEGYIKNVKIYNNTISKTLITAGRWDFAIEIWNWEGGNEIYDNVITGSIDIVGATTKGSSTYSVWVHDNSIGQSAYSTKQSVRGILLEGLNTDVLIERNYIHQVCQGIYMQTANWLDPPNTIYRLTQTNITIRYNVFEKIGSSAASSGWGFYLSQEDGDDPVTNFNFYNNTIVGGTNAQWGISIPDCSISSSNVNILNNIVQDFAYAPARMNDWSSGATKITGLNIKNNIFYGNGNSNNPSFASGTTVLNYVNSGNLTTQPPFTSSTDFHLTAARTGVFIASGLTDKDEAGVANPPTIGAYEFDPVGEILVTAITVTGTGGATTIVVDKGTLQMLAHIDPHDATVQTVIWSVVPGTGTASIDQSGMLTAISNGTVTVKATSND